MPTWALLGVLSILLVQYRCTNLGIFGDPQFLDSRESIQLFDQPLALSPSLPGLPLNTFAAGGGFTGQAGLGNM